MTDTRYLYLLIISNFSCFLSASRPAENGCKSTTFFHSDKIFFQKNFPTGTNNLSSNTIKSKKNYRLRQIRPKTHGFSALSFVNFAPFPAKNAKSKHKIKHLAETQ